MDVVNLSLRYDGRVWMAQSPVSMLTLLHALADFQANVTQTFFRPCSFIGYGGCGQGPA